MSLCKTCGGTGEVKVHCLYGLGGDANDHNDDSCPDPQSCMWADDHPCPDCSWGRYPVEKATA